MNSFSIANLVLAGVAAYVGAFHLIFYLRIKEHKGHLSFSFLCFSVCLYDVASAGVYNTSIIETGMIWQRLQSIALILFAAIAIWFTAATRKRSFHKKDYLLLVGWAALFCLYIFDRSNLTILNVSSIKTFKLFGTVYSYSEVGSGLAASLRDACGFLTIGYVLVNMILFCKREHHPETCPIVMGMCILAIACLNDLAVGNHVYGFFYLIEYAFTILILCMTYSLTETHLAISEKLRQTEDRYRQLYESESDAIVLLDANTRDIIDINPAACRQYGYTKEEFMGLPALTLSADPGKSKAAIKQTASEGSIFVPLAHHRKKDGTVFPVEVSSGRFASEGRQMISAIFRDISERVRTDEDLKRLAAAVHAAAECIVVTDKTGTIQYINPCFEEMTGYTKDEILGKTPRILKSGKHDDDFYKNLWNTISRGDTWHGRFTNKKKDGTSFEEEATISPVRDADNKIVNYVAVKRDITREINLEGQLQHSQKMEAVGELAGRVAHDFTNMLVVILGHAQLARATSPSNDDLQKHIDEIVQAATRVSALTTELMSFAHKQKISLKHMDLNKVVKGLKDLLEQTMQNDVRLDINLSCTPIIMELDPSQIEQIIVHLAVNAQNAMKDGGTLTIKTNMIVLSQDDIAQLKMNVVDNNGLKEGSFGMLIVSDTGCGMDKEIRSHIFDPFFTTRGKGSSTGLGLPTVHNIVRRHNAYITAETIVGKGSTFTIYLPIAHDQTS
ncbi:MAG: PAS domain S-box protein [Kiritimatiellae bacterium]|nr:PAS domain S-box protein [Kiritimatiellia bacterium]